MIRRIVGIILIALFIVSCGNQREIKIGFAGSLSGNGHEMGTAAHNGFLIAQNEINSTGGINGRMITSYIKDDQSTLDIAKKLVDEFVTDDVQFVVGFLTSNMTPAVELGLEKNLFFISPSISTPLLSEKDDFFIRTASPMEFEAKELAHYTYDVGVRKLSVIYDMDNEIYTKKYLEILSHEFLLQDTELVLTQALYDDYDSTVEKLIESNTDGLCLITSAHKASEILQRLQKNNYSIPVGLSQWTMANELIEKGGKSVENSYGVSIYNQYNLTDNFTKFRDKYYARFNTEPSFASITTYESVMVLREALETSQAPEKVKEHIINRSYNILQNEFYINKYGDSVREYFIVRIKNGAITFEE
jgi:branched-chain amino acid transport system substrate-binding protein